MKWALYSGDCRAIEPHGFDILLTDPPYSAYVHASAVSQSKVRGARKRELGFDSLSVSLRRYIARCASGALRWSVLYSDLESTAWLRIAAQAAGAKYIRTVPWIRWSMPQLSGDRPPQGAEALLLFWGAAKGRKSWNGPGNLTHLSHKCLRGESKHRAEKPLDQCLDLVDWFSNPNELIYDPCAGAGTIGVACALLGRRYMGAEIDPKCHERASDRIAAAHRGNLSARDCERLNRWLATKGQQS